MAYHDKLRNELNNVSVHFTIRQHLIAIGGSYLDEINVAPTFFTSTLDAHNLATLMGINRLIDTSDRHLSIYSLLDFVKENTAIFTKKAFVKRLRLLGRYDEIALKDKTKVTAQVVESDIQRVRNLPTSHMRRWRTNKVPP